VSVALRRSFASLSVPNYRRYFTGQVISISGNWMQIVAEMWLVVQLTGNGVSVGLTAALQFLPVLVFGVWGGVLADRMPKRRLLMFTQTAMAVPALTLWALTVGGAVEVWMVYALVLVRGAVTAIDNPARQSFVSEIVGGDRVVNAVALNSLYVHTARIVGPAAAGGVIALLGVGPCFALNALSFGAMLLALRRMDPEQLQPAPIVARARGQLRSALAHVRATPALWIPLAMMVAIGTFSYNFQVLLPLLADFTWNGTATTYALLTSAMGIGSVAGALTQSARGRVGPGLLVGAATALGTFELLAAAAPTLPLQIAALIPLGAATVTFSSGVNSSLQLSADPEMRGRVMALYAVVFIGSTPIGAPLAGWLSEVSGPRAGMLLGAVVALGAGATAAAGYARARRRAAAGAHGPTSRAAPVAERRPGAHPAPRPQPERVRAG
jgi:MFS family permease